MSTVIPDDLPEEPVIESQGVDKVTVTYATASCQCFTLKVRSSSFWSLREKICNSVTFQTPHPNFRIIDRHVDGKPEWTVVRRRVGILFNIARTPRYWKKEVTNISELADVDEEDNEETLNL